MLNKYYRYLYSRNSLFVNNPFLSKKKKKISKTNKFFQSLQIFHNQYYCYKSK